MKSKIIMMSLFVPFLVSFSYSAIAQTENSVNEKAKEQEAARLKGKQIVAIEFTGNKFFSNEELLDALNRRNTEGQIKNLLLGENYDVDRVEYGLQIFVRNFMRSRGYLRARFGEPKVDEYGESVKLVIPVEEGIRYRWGSIQVKGTNAFSPSQVLQVLNIKTGDVANGELLIKGLFEILRDAYQESGYLQYDVEPEPEFQDPPKGLTEGVVKLTIRIDEGSVFRVKEIKFEGNVNTSNDRLREMISIRDGEIFNVKKFKEGIKQLNDSEFFEYIDSEKDVERRTDNEEESVSVVIKVQEKKPARTFILRSIKFIGNKTISEETLCSYFLIKEGEVVNVTRLLQSIEQLNNTGLIEKLDESDIRFEIGEKGSEDDETSDQLTITIKVKELPQTPKPIRR